MARAKLIDIDLDSINSDGVAESQTPSGAGDLTLDGALMSGGVATFDFARKLGITSAGDDSGRTFTITGVDADGAAQTEAVTGPNTTQVETTKYWGSGSLSISVDAATAGAITVGTVDEAITHTIPLNRSINSRMLILGFVTGTVAYTVQQTTQDVQASGALATQSGDWQAVSGMSSQSANALGQTTAGATACRVIIESYSAGAAVRVRYNQPRIV